jgi:hypothetical protein
MWWLITRCAALAATLTSENFTDWIKEKQKIATFVLLTAEWCKECKRFESCWCRLKARYLNESTIMIADIWSEMLHGLFPGVGLPRIVWIEGGSDIARGFVYSDSYSCSYESFVSFLDGKLSPIMSNIWNESEYLDTISEHRYDSLFFLYDPSSISSSTTTSTSTPSPIEDYLIELWDQFNQYPIRFFKINYEMPEVEEATLIHEFGLRNETNRFPITLSSSSSRLSLSSKLMSQRTKKSIREFVFRHALPSVVRVSSFFMKIAMTMPSVILYEEGLNLSTEGDLNDLLNEFGSSIQIGIIDCHLQRRFCSPFGLDRTRGSQLVFIKPKQNLYYKYSGDFSRSSISEWILRSSRGQAESFGPGSGFRGLFFNFRTSFKRHLFTRFSFVSVVIVCFLILIVFVVRNVNSFFEGDAAIERKRIAVLADKIMEAEAEAMLEDLIRADSASMKRKLD